MGRNKQNNSLPTFDKLIIPTVKALIQLGGSGTVEEINAKVYEIASLSEDILQIPHLDSTTISEVDYRLSWSRTYLKKYGLLENSMRGIWALLRADTDVTTLDSDEIVKKVREHRKFAKDEILEDKPNNEQIDFEVNEEVNNIEKWKEKLLNILYGITPSAFERLAQRILRESGFSQVEVTGKSGDGGIDGKGIVRISGLLSFHVIFQCKRYKGTITPSQIRDFRGAMQGRADKGLFITTGTFTKEAIKEATRDGAPPIDLINGELLCDKMKELNLGVDKKLTEVIDINNNWFSSL